MAAVTGTQVAERFLDALEARDFYVAAQLFAEDGWLRTLGPQRLHEDEGPDMVDSRFNFSWGDLDQLELVSREVARVHDRTAIRFRWRGRDPDDGWIEVEQSGYLRLGGDGRIIVMNVADSGFIPVA